MNPQPARVQWLRGIGGLHIGPRPVDEEPKAHGGPIGCRIAEALGGGPIMKLLVDLAV